MNCKKDPEEEQLIRALDVRLGIVCFPVLFICTEFLLEITVDFSLEEITGQVGGSLLGFRMIGIGVIGGVEASKHCYL